MILPINIDTETAKIIVEFVTALATVLAVIVALFREELISFVWKPILVIHAENDQFHIHNVKINNAGAKQLWLGISIENIGNRYAKNVEVLISGIKSNVVDDISKYKSLPLVTSWTGKTIIEQLAPGIPIRLDICYMCNYGDNGKNKVYFRFASTPNELASVTNELATTNLYNQSARFEFEIFVISSNASSRRKKITIQQTDFDLEFK